MNEQIRFHENRIKELAAGFAYPATPDIAGDVRKRLLAENGRRRQSSMRLAWAVVLAVILAAGLLLVPQVRAAFLRIFNIGAITIFEVEDMDELVANTAVLSAVKQTPIPIVRAGLVEEITFAEAQEQSLTPLYLPTYPSDLAQPDHLYLYSSDKGWPPALIYVWPDAQPVAEDGLALYQIDAARFALKGVEVLEETTVNGERAFWLGEPHYFMVPDDEWQEWQFVDGNVLIWWHESGLTFRLEGAVSLEEALRIAESLAKVEK